MKAKWHKKHGTFVKCDIVETMVGDDEKYTSIRVGGKVRMVLAHQVYPLEPVVNVVASPTGDEKYVNVKNPPKDPSTKSDGEGTDEDTGEDTGEDTDTGADTKLT